MKKRNKLLLFLMTCVMVLLFGTMASAKTIIRYQVDKYRLNRVFSMYCGEGFTVLADFDMGDDVKISVTNSNKKVASVWVGKDLKGVQPSASVNVLPKTPGKTTVTIQFTVNGKVYKKVLKYTYAAYENPFSSFKVAGKEKVSQFNKLKKDEENEGYWDFTGKITAGKLSYKMKRGYKIINFSVGRSEDENNDGEEEYKILKVTNNFELKKGDGISIRYKDLKTKTYGYLWFNVS